MQKSNLSEMTKGWFIGDFEPSLLKTTAAEVAVKHYKAGDSEAWHYHKIATEFTVVISGAIRMNGVRYSEGDIITIPPGEGTDFEALSDTCTAVVKIPGAPNDKYSGEAAR